MYVLYCKYYDEVKMLGVSSDESVLKRLRRFYIDGHTNVRVLIKRYNDECSKLNLQVSNMVKEYLWNNINAINELDETNQPKVNPWHFDNGEPYPEHLKNLKLKIAIDTISRHWYYFTKPKDVWGNSKTISKYINFDKLENYTPIPEPVYPEKPNNPLGFNIEHENNLIIEEVKEF